MVVPDVPDPAVVDVVVDVYVVGVMPITMTIRDPAAIVTFPVVEPVTVTSDVFFVNDALNDVTCE